MTAFRTSRLDRPATSAQDCMTGSSLGSSAASLVSPCRFASPSTKTIGFARVNKCVEPVISRATSSRSVLVVSRLSWFSGARTPG